MNIHADLSVPDRGPERGYEVLPYGAADVRKGGKVAQIVLWGQVYSLRMIRGLGN